MHLHTPVTEVEREIQRQEISKLFPKSISDYLHSTTATPCSPVTVKTNSKESNGYIFRTKLKELDRIRQTLDDNISIAQRGRKGEFTQLFTPKLQDNQVGRIKIMVNSAIATMIPKINEEVNHELKIEREKPNSKLEKLSISEKNEKSFFKKTSKVGFGRTVHTKNNSVSSKKALVPKQLVSKSTRLEEDTEQAVTHVYGKGKYHTRRSTVHQPYFHTLSPVKQPKFRMKRAVEHIPVSYAKSEKSQTTNINHHTPSYYFSPSMPAKQSKIKSEATKGNLFPLALSLGPPKIVDTIPVIIPVGAVATDVQHSATIKNCAVQDNKIILPTVANLPAENEAENSQTNNSNEIFEEGFSVDQNGVQLNGKNQISGKQQASYHSSNIAPPPVPSTSSADLAEIISQEQVESYTKQWVEQEIMAKIIHALYKPTIKSDSDLLEKFHHQPVRYLIDPGMQIDQSEVENILEEEICGIIRRMIEQNEKDKAIPRDEHEIQSPLRPRSPVVPVTPLPSPAASLTPPLQVFKSTNEQFPPIIQAVIHTPSITPEVSITESIEYAPEITIPESLNGIVQESPVKEIVKTPDITRPSSPCSTVELDPVVASSLSEGSIALSPNDCGNWEGLLLPLPEDTNVVRNNYKLLKPTVYEASTAELVVRCVTPSPLEKSCTSDESTDSLSSSESHTNKDDATISEGQLLISHGEMQVRKRPINIPNNKLDLGMRDSMDNTLIDSSQLDCDNHVDLISEGEFQQMPKQKTIWPYSMVEKKHELNVYNYESSAVKSVMAHCSNEDLSIGEVLDGNVRKKKFMKWKKSRSPRLHKSTGKTDALDETDSQIGDLNSSEESYVTRQSVGKNVINVTPATGKSHVGGTLTMTVQSESTIYKDSLDVSKEKHNNDGPNNQNKMLFTIPSALNFSLDESDADELSVHELD